MVTCAKTAEPIVMLFGLSAQNSTRNRELDGVQVLHEKGQFSGHTVVSCVEMAELIDLPFRLWTRVG